VSSASPAASCFLSSTCAPTTCVGFSTMTGRSMRPHEKPSRSGTVSWASRAVSQYTSFLYKLSSLGYCVTATKKASKSRTARISCVIKLFCSVHPTVGTCVALRNDRQPGFLFMHFKKEHFQRRKSLQLHIYSRYKNHLSNTFY
jgi:hypothetical protein